MRFPPVIYSLFLGIAITAHAAPLDRQAVPADAKWVVHIDLDAARAAQVAQKVYDDWLSHGIAHESLRDIRQTLGMDLLEDVRGITFYATRFEPYGGVVLIRAKVNRPRLMELLEANSTHAVHRRGSRELHTWVQEVESLKSTLAGCFYGPNLVVISRRLEEVEAALAVLDAKAPSLAGSGSGLDRSAAQGTVFQGGVIDLSELADEELPFVSPIIRNADAIAVDIGEDDGRVFLRLRIGTPSAAVAGRVRDVIVGFRGMTGLERHGDQGTLDALDALDIAAEGATVNVDWRMPGPKVMRLIEQEWVKQRQEE